MTPGGSRRSPSSNRSGAPRATERTQGYYVAADSTIQSFVYQQAAYAAIEPAGDGSFQARETTESGMLRDDAEAVPALRRTVALCCAPALHRVPVLHRNNAGTIYRGTSPCSMTRYRYRVWSMS